MVSNVIAGFIGSVVAGILLWWLRNRLEARSRKKPHETSSSIRQVKSPRKHVGSSPAHSTPHLRSRSTSWRTAFRIVEWPLRLSFMAAGAFGSYALLGALTGLHAWFWAVPGFVLGGWLQAFLLENW